MKNALGSEVRLGGAPGKKVEQKKKNAKKSGRQAGRGKGGTISLKR